MYPAPEGSWEQSHIGNGPPSRLEAWEKEAAVLLVNRTPSVSVVQEPNQKSTPDQRQVSDRCHLTTAANEESEAPCTEDCTQLLPFPDISWEGWGLIKTSDGVYLPETFNPFPHVFEDLTDQW